MNQSTYFISTPDGVFAVQDPLPPYVQEPGVPPFFRTLHEESVLDPNNPLVRLLDIHGEDGYVRCLEAVESLKVRGKDGQLIHEFLKGGWPPNWTRFAGGISRVEGGVILGYAFTFLNSRTYGVLGMGLVLWGPSYAEHHIMERVQECRSEYMAVCAQGDGGGRQADV
jgi:hypothetical protein